MTTAWAWRTGKLVRAVLGDVEVRGADRALLDSEGRGSWVVGPGGVARTRPFIVLIERGTGEVSASNDSLTDMT